MLYNEEKKSISKARKARQSQVTLTLFSNNFTYDAEDSVSFCSLITKAVGRFTMLGTFYSC